MLRRKHFPEANVSGFSHVDPGVAMYTQISSILRPSDRVLDFGAGRGEHIVDQDIEFRRRLYNLQGRCAHLEGCDLDEAVLENPYLDHAAVLQFDNTLPYPSESFDIVVSRFVFEHIADPAAIAEELLRVTKPGGVIVAITPNKYGYIAFAANAVPNRWHVRVLRQVQPKRKAEDVFPTVYGLNTAKAIKECFGRSAETHVAYIAGEPAYHFGSPFLYVIFKWLHKHMPAKFHPLLIVYIRKNIA